MPELRRSRIRDAHGMSMERTLRHSVEACQRHSVDLFAFNCGMDTIGSRIRAVREKQDISRADLAKSAGIKPSTLSDLELGLSKTTTALHKIARRLGVSVDWLETGREERREEKVIDKSHQPMIQSQSQRPDPAILIATQTFLDRAFELGGKEFLMLNDAELFADAYEWICVDERPADQRNLIDFAQWRSTRDKQRGGADGQDRAVTAEASGKNRSRTA